MYSTKYTTPGFFYPLYNALFSGVFYVLMGSSNWCLYLSLFVVAGVGFMFCKEGVNVGV